MKETELYAIYKTTLLIKLVGGDNIKNIIILAYILIATAYILIAIYNL